jgi:hypothetical protein
MTDPFKNVLEMQSAMLEGWLSSCRHAMQCWQRWADMQGHFLHHASHRGKLEIAKGPSFTDHYGKRSHDIDPERDV